MNHSVTVVKWGGGNLEEEAPLSIISIVIENMVERGDTGRYRLKKKNYPLQRTYLGHTYLCTKMQFSLIAFKWSYVCTSVTTFKVS